MGNQLIWGGGSKNLKSCETEILPGPKNWPEGESPGWGVVAVIRLPERCPVGGSMGKLGWGTPPSVSSLRRGKVWN